MQKYLRWISVGTILPLLMVAALCALTASAYAGVPGVVTVKPATKPHPGVVTIKPKQQPQPAAPEEPEEPADAPEEPDAPELPAADDEPVVDDDDFSLDFDEDDDPDAADDSADDSAAAEDDLDDFDLDPDDLDDDLDAADDEELDAELDAIVSSFRSRHSAADDDEADDAEDADLDEADLPEPAAEPAPKAAPAPRADAPAHGAGSTVRKTSPFVTRGAAPENDVAKSGAETKAPTVVTDRVRVTLNKPLPSSREPLRFETVFAADPNPAQDANPAAGAAGDLEIVGREIVDARLRAGNGKYMLEDEYGELRIIPQAFIESVEPAADIAVAELRKKYEERLLEEFGEGFKVKGTEHFLFVSNASDGYVDWCGRLFESLEEGFRLFARKNGLELEDRGAPLVVVVFARQAEFMSYAAVETSAPDKLAAYYNMQTNRVALYDLSNTEGTSNAPSAKRRKARIVETREILSRPNAAFNVATVVHEATHQIAFNRGVFLRTGPVALWAAEGTSLVFETPNGLAAQGGWSFHGSFPVNKRMLELFRTSVGGMKEPFRTVVAQDDFYANLEGSYAASWALFYYLYKKRPADLAKYLRHIASKGPCTVYPASERIADFEKFFGADWEKTNAAVLRYLKRL